MQRRKKAAESAKTSPPPAPLQPAYFALDEVPTADTAESATTTPVREETQMEDGPASDREPSESTQDEAGNSLGPGPLAAISNPLNQNQPRRRRRGRGGRGRRQNGGESAPVSQRPVAEPQLAPVTRREPLTEAPATTQAHARLSKGIVVLAIGLPGSGKSSWFKRHSITPLSSDLLRALLFDDPTEQRYQDLIFSNLRSMLKARLIARRPMNYVDATNLTPHDRHSWIKLAKDYGYETQALFFDVPLEVCMARNQKRKRVVGEDVMQRMADKLKAPTFEEGFTKITVVRVKHRDQ